MIYLIFSILSSTGIFVIFKFLDYYKVSTFPVIIYNYLFAAILGFSLNQIPVNINSAFQSNWTLMAVLIGVLFIIMFYIIGLSSQKAGISVTTVASKMSVVTPVIFSIIYDPADTVTTVKVAGIILALIAVFLTIHKPGVFTVNQGAFFLPVILFFGMGIVDSLVKYAQYEFVSDNQLAFFSAVLFSIAFLTGMITLIFRKKRFLVLLNKKALFWGVLLGGSNFGSIFFFIRALNYKSNVHATLDSSVIFGVNNTGIVVLSVLTGLVIFNEKLRKQNLVGIILAIVAIIIFAYTR